MGLFTGKQRLTETAADPPVLGPGCTVTSALDLDGCLRVLDQTLRSFRVPEYTHLPTFTKASWAWTGSRPWPRRSWSSAPTSRVITCS